MYQMYSVESREHRVASFTSCCTGKAIRHIPEEKTVKLNRTVFIITEILVFHAVSAVISTDKTQILYSSHERLEESHNGLY